jgi:hypothetical protein
MKNAKQTFHLISYLQYPLLLMGLYFAYRPLLLSDFDSLWVGINKGLVFVGLGISFSTLQDTQKVQNNFSRKIFENPKKSRIFLMVLLIQIVLFMGFGLFGLFFAESKPIQEVSFGVIALAIGMIGQLKAAIEMAENHKKPEPVIS